jgi:hypothetical protein
MGCSTRRRVLLPLLVALACEGCVTGHLLDEARRYERPLVYRAAELDGDRLILAYSAAVTDQFGERLGVTNRRVAIATSELRADVPVERLHVERLSDDGAPHGRPIPVRATASCPDGDGPFVTLADFGDETRVVLCERAGPVGQLYAAALVTTRTAAWAYPFVPFTLAVDAVSNPLLLILAPAVITVGD